MEVRVAATIRRTTKYAAVQLMADNQWLWQNSWYRRCKWEVYSFYQCRSQERYEVDSMYLFQRQAIHDLQDMLDEWHKGAHDAAVNKQLPQQTTAADNPQPQTRRQQQHQHHMRKADDMRRQQQWAPKRQQQNEEQQQDTEPLRSRQSFQTSDLRLLSFLEEAEVASATMRPFWRDHNRSDGDLELIWSLLKAKEARYKTNDARLIRKELLAAEQQHDSRTTLKANSPRGGDDWAD